ncbi:MAG: 1,4-dihydroxy-2-naphthoate polyprenyltransferase [Chloroflexi bacterium 44-23]|nr:MAG: 1,4-dihydroxy-2-naphthoate polyprenyltransferase [Chloroflexi bacterium 44-23]
MPMQSDSILSPINKSKAWILASRPKTLTAAATPVIIGSSVAFFEQTFQPLAALAALIGALCLQIGANLANDIFDFQKGVDNQDRLGPLRVTQAGLLSPTEVKIGMSIVFLIASLCGVYMTLVSGLWIVVIGILAILAAVAYTGGPFPYGYRGLGELFVFIFFGFAAVCGTYYAQAGSVSQLAFFSSIPVGLLIVAILIVNNLRDLEGDLKSGKRTLAVKFGLHWARQEFVVVIAFAYLVVFLMGISNIAPAWVLLSWLSLPAVFGHVHSVMYDEGSVLNTTLASTGMLTLIFGLLYSGGLILAYYIPLF